MDWQNEILVHYLLVTWTLIANKSSRHFEDNGSEEIDQRSEPQSVTSYLQGTTNNLSFHWNLTVIKPHKEIVYVLDSLSHRICDEGWKYVMEMALRLFNSNNGRKGRKHVQWEVIKAPRQPDAKQCGYYVMRFMRQITEEITMIEGDTLPSIIILSLSSQIIRIKLKQIGNVST
ncbi:uncharacterized protein LOC121978236 [Zingiber officinale]|uniref:uncharacterized protein LOC121978236 n=1 Tax=Zingiber officinale TaxID=94328 RepID=UPI001C4C1135|nr:uncharacterized protein LOC121978236 [Zingiber officinale]